MSGADGSSVTLRPVSGTPTEVESRLRRWLAQTAPPALTVSTSGSTGAPKDVELSATAVRASATAALERLGGPGHWLLALPVNYVAGLQVIARSILGGGHSPVALDDHRHWYRYHHLFADALRARLSAERPDRLRVLHRAARLRTR